MPVTIHEMHVIVKVNERKNNQRNTTNAANRKQERDASEDALVAECVSQTLDILARKKER